MSQKSILVAFSGIFKQRVDRFKIIKYRSIKNAQGGRTPEVSIAYDINAFLTLYKKIIDTPDVTGVRVYFACYVRSNTGNPANDQQNDHERIPLDSQKQYKTGFLTLLFAPTKIYGGTDLADNGSDYYIFNAKGDGYVLLSKTEASDWVKAYQSGGMLHELNTNMGSDGDTKSLWYNISNIQYTYRDIRLNHINETKLITAFFGAYLQNESVNIDFGRQQGIIFKNLSNQLTLVFCTGSGPTVNLESIVKRLWEKARFLFTMINPADYDTGAPCPPNIGCNGSSL